MSMNPDHGPVAAVIGNEVRIYGPMEAHKGKQSVRPLWDIRRFNNYGQARFHAQEYDDIGKAKK